MADNYCFDRSGEGVALTDARSRDIQCIEYVDDLLMNYISSFNNLDVLHLQKDLNKSHHYDNIKGVRVGPCTF